MGTITAQVLANRCKVSLKDPSAVTWPEADLLTYANDAQRAIASKISIAYVKVASVQLVAGIKQAIPADGHGFVGCPRNMGSDGNTPGKMIFPEDYASYALVNPNWPTDTASATVDAVMVRESDRKTFYVAPPQPASGMGYVELEYAAIPANIALISDTIVLDDSYANAIYYYMMAAAHAKEVSGADSGQVAGWMAMFNGELPQ